VPTTALLLALAAAGLHAFWNLVIARARDVEAATAVVLALSLVLYAPVAALTWDVERDVWPYAAASSLLELAYVVLLAAAYRRADLSVVYPVARGVAPVLVLVVGVALLRAKTSAAEVGGVLLVAGGVLLVRGIRVDPGPGVPFGLAIACSIAAYTLVDNRGIEHADPFGYLELVMAGPAVIYLGAILARKGVEPVRSQVTLAALLAAVASFGAYGLALAALQLASAASVAAVRETSIVIAVALAAPVLRERVGARRLAGAVVVAAGVALLGVS
jgi:drug/metabolite transporter (DMT)-like permease